MHTDYLVKMVNEIAAFFEGEDDPQEAARGIAGHLQRFWDPRMRRQIIAHLEDGGSDLSDAAHAGIEVLRAQSAAASAGAAQPTSGSSHV